MAKTEYSYKEEQLLEMLVSNSEYAFKIIFETHRNRIFKLAMRYLKSPVLAQEVVQDVFMKLWTKRNTIKTTTPVEGWLVTVAKNDILNRIKKLANEWKALNHLKASQVFEDNSTQEKIENADYDLILKEALGCLTEKQLQVYSLARQNNLSYLQIAEHLEISPLTVKTHMSRALCHIRSFLNSQRIFAS